MAHNLETYGDQASFVSARESAWHTLGTVTSDALSAADAARLAHLDGWDVRKIPLTTAGTDADSGIVIPNKVATVRTNPYTQASDVLGVVGIGYKVIQNEQAFDVLDAIVDEGGAHFETAGSILGGTRVFMSMKMPEGMMVGGTDAHDLYLLATNSHDGGSAFTLGVTPVRVVCNNTLDMALGGLRQKWTMRHTSNVEGKIALARESLKLTYKYADEFTAQMDALLDQEFTTEQFNAMVKAELILDTASEHDGWKDRVALGRKQLSDLFVNAETNEFGRGTKWAALNAATEYADWYMPVKGADPDGSKRATRIMSGGVVSQFKSRALAALV